MDGVLHNIFFKCKNDINIMINTDGNLEVVNKVKYLGIVLNNKVTFISHVTKNKA